MIIKPINNINIPNKIMEQIKMNIVNKDLKPGDKLPSERELSEKTGASRASVREALRALEMIGVINTVWGDGSYINENIEGNLSESIGLLFSLSGHSYEQVIQLRRSIELETVSIAAKNATEEDIRVLRDIFDKMENTSNIAESAEYDRQLHYEIAKMTKNIFFINLLRGIHHIITSFILIARENIVESEEGPKLMRQHSDLIDAIESKDPLKAREIMLGHMELVEKYYMKK